MFLATLAACVPIFLANDKKLYPYTYLLSLGSIEYRIFILNPHYLIIKVTFILSSTSNGLLA